MNGVTDSDSLAGADLTDSARASMPNLNEPLSVLWLTPDKPADISVGRRRIASHLEAAGFDVTLRGTTPRTLLRALQDGGRYDLVVGTTRAGALAGVLVSRRHGIPVVVDHVDPIQQFYETAGWPVAAVVDRLERLAFRLAAHVLYVYPEEATRVEERAGAVTKTDLGVDYDRFADPAAGVVEAARERVGDVSDDVVIYVGGLEPIYEIEPLLESMDSLDDWTLVVAGAGSLEDHVRQAAAESHRIQYIGTVPHDEVPGLLHLADVGVSLVDDPYTLKVLEYGAAGLAVVQRAGTAESRFGDRVTYTTTDPPAIAQAIRRADETAGHTGLASFVQRFDWATIAGEYGTVLATVSRRG